MVRALERISPTSFMRRSPLDGSEIGEFHATKIDDLFSFSSIRVGEWQDSLEVRASVLGNFLRILESRGPELCALVRLETGKPTKLALDELAAASRFGELLLDSLFLLADREITSTIRHRIARLKARPFDLSLLVSSYNTPLPNFAWKLFPALLSGSKIVFKPSPYTAHSSLQFCEYLFAAGVPREVLFLANGTAETVMDAIQLQPDFVSLTGSLGAGRAVSEATSSFFPKLVLELGGSNPFIVMDTGNIDEAVEFLVSSAFSNSGQRCAAGSRLLVSSDLHDTFMEALIANVKNKTFGTSPGDWSGTLVDVEKNADFLTYLEDASKLAEVISPLGERSDGFCLALPQIIDVPKTSYRSELFHREVFSPVLRVFEVEDASTALALANESRQTLTASVWTDDDQLFDIISAGLRVGLINRNGPTHGAEPSMPFGGQKLSGNGQKDAGASSLEVYSDWFVHTAFHH